MSAIICFDIRNFSTHVSYRSSRNNTKIIFKVIEDIFSSLDEAIKISRKYLAIKRKTFINHTGDGFVAIFYGKGRSLQGLFVASLIANDVQKIIEEYNANAKKEKYIKLVPPLEYGIGLHRGKVNKLSYHQEYPANHSAVGFLGNAINLSDRVQESTKDHTFHIICTESVYDDAISIIKQEYKEITEKYFNKLGRHKLRGMKKPVPLYGVNIGFAKKIKPNMILKTIEN